jgi:hypothetical protein
VAKSANSAERRERLAAALRENLKRRKARARTGTGEGAHPPAQAPAHAPDLPGAGSDKAAKPD